MGNTDTARTVIGIIGNVISFGLFLSPSPTMSKIIKHKSVQDFKPDPYVATVLNCAMWVTYGLPSVHPDTILVLTINSLGFALELTYVAIYFTFASWDKRRKILIALAIEAVFMVIILIITLEVFHSTDDRSMFVGILAIIFNIIMYASPLTVMRMVIKTKSVKYMPFFLSLANFGNGVIWVIYALLKFDQYILIPNALGAVSGLVQLVLYATFYKTTRWDDDDDDDQKPQSEVQLSNV